MERLIELLPITVVAALVLFLAKETIEAVRRWRADARRRRAFRVLLARECELNNWTCKTLKRTLDEIQADSKEAGSAKYSIRRLKSDEIIFRREQDTSWSEHPLPEARVDVMARLMLDVASLDKALFDDLEAAYDSVIEVQHVRESLIRFVESDEEHEKQFLETLPHYGLQEIDDALTALAKLYKTCTGEPLKYIRVR